MCDHLPKATANPKDQSFPVKALQFEPLVMDHSLGLRINDFPSCNWSLDAFSDLHVHCVHYAN